jgi:hypothetical protein
MGEEIFYTFVIGKSCGSDFRRVGRMRLESEMVESDVFAWPEPLRNTVIGR